MAEIIPSDDAKDYVNDENIEIQWAMKTFNHAEIYFNLICSVDPKQLRLTELDDEIYKKFRNLFEDLKIDVIDEEEMKSKEGKEKWRPYCEDFKGRTEDYNFGTLLRIDCTGEYNEKNTTLVPRVQFLAIEIARNREGYNCSLREKYKSNNKKGESETS